MEPEQKLMNTMNQTERQLLFNSYLMIKDTPYLIVEAELYANEDPYTHKDKQQYKDQTFYFHRINGKGFKEGSFKGMDITFGNGDEARAYLIRAIKPAEGDGSVIEGPCLVVQTILKAFDHSKVKEFHQEYSKSNPDFGISNSDSGFWLKTGQIAAEPVLNLSPRVGLKFKPVSGVEPGVVLKYCMGPYRYILNPFSLKKQASTIKMARTKTVYKEQREAGANINPSDLYEAVKPWKVADIAKCYGCYEAQVSGSEN